MVLLLWSTCLEMFNGFALDGRPIEVREVCWIDIPYKSLFELRIDLRRIRRTKVDLFARHMMTDAVIVITAVKLIICNDTNKPIKIAL